MNRVYDPPKRPLGVRQAQILISLRDGDLCGQTANQLRDMIITDREIKPNDTRYVHAIIRRLELMGLVEKVPVPLEERKAPSQGGSWWLFRITVDGRKALEAEGL